MKTHFLVTAALAALFIVNICLISFSQQVEAVVKALDAIR